MSAWTMPCARSSGPARGRWSIDVWANCAMVTAYARVRETEPEEFRVGWPTVQAIVGNKLAPDIGDLYLARTGFEAQQDDEPVEPDRRDNLFEPVPGRFGAHGRFDDRSRARSVHFALTKYRDVRTSGAGALAAGVALRRLL